MTDTEFANHLRAVQALRTGLRAQAERPAFRPLDVSELVRDASRTRRSGRWVGVAVAVAAVAAAGALILSSLNGSSIPAAPAPAASPTPASWPYGQWTKIAASPLSPRWEASGVWVDGRYLVLGGHSDFLCPANADCVANTWLTDGALYDAATDTWTTIPPMPTQARVGQPVALGSAVYLLAWETFESRTPALLRYDTMADVWSTFAVPVPIDGELVATADRLVIISWSDELGEVDDQVFDPVTGDFSALPADPLGPSFSRGALWLGDRLLLTAHDLVPNPGAEAPSLVRMAELDDALTVWETLPDTPILGSGALAVDERVVFASTGSADGGEVGNWGRSYPEGGIYDPATGRWTELPESPGPGGLRGALVAVGGRVAVDGNLLDPVTLAWTVVPAVPGGPETGETFIGGADDVLVWGGGDDENPTADGYLFVPVPQKNRTTVAPGPTLTPSGTVPSGEEFVPPSAPAASEGTPSPSVLSPPGSSGQR